MLLVQLILNLLTLLSHHDLCDFIVEWIVLLGALGSTHGYTHFGHIPSNAKKQDSS